MLIAPPTGIIKPQPGPVGMGHCRPEWRWFWRAVSAFSPLWAGHRTYLLDASGAVLDSGDVGSSAAWKLGGYGIGLEVAGSTEDASNLGTADVITQGHCAIVVVLNNHDAATDAWYCIVTKRLNDQETRWFFYYRGDAVGQVQWGSSESETRTFTTGAFPSGPKVIGLSDDGTASEAFLNGVSVGQQGSLAFYNSPTSPIHIGHRRDGQERLNANFVAVYFFNRPLSRYEHAALAADPFAPFRPASRQVSIISSAPVGPVYAQAEYRARNDDGSEAAATWKATADTPWNQVIGQPFRVRVRVENSGATATPKYGWQYTETSGGEWSDMPPQGATGVPIRYADSIYLTDAGATTQQLGSGSFDAGRIYESDHALSVTMTADGETEVEGAFELVSGQISPTDKVWLRVVREATE